MPEVARAITNSMEVEVMALARERCQYFSTLIQQIYYELYSFPRMEGMEPAIERLIEARMWLQRTYDVSLKYDV